MKKILIGLVALCSFSVFAECARIASVNKTVCADVVVRGEEFVLSNFSLDIEKARSIGKEMCDTFGDGFSEYDAKITTKKSCKYFSTRGFFAGGMVSACNDFGGFSRGTVFSKIKCSLKN